MIKGLFADIIIAVFLLSTLLVRMMVEPALQKHPLISIGLGVVMLAFLWALIKIGVLDPNYFGLLKKKESKESKA